MTNIRPGSWIYAEEFIQEPEVIERARIRGEQLGCMPVSASTGSTLSTLAAATSARAVVEIGSGAGTSGLWLLAGMPDDGILTTIDINSEHLHEAKRAYAEAGYPAQRTRAIHGSALSVMPRLTDGGYDMVLVDGEKIEYPQYVEQALRLLRAGGVLAVDNMLWGGKVADPAVRDDATRTLRDLGKELREAEDLTVTLLAVGDGLLVAVKH